MTALISLDEAKRHLRVDHTDDDQDITDKMDEATEIVLDYIKKTIAVPAPPDGRVAALAAFDGGDGQVVLPNWIPLPFVTLAGAAATLESGSLRFTTTGEFAGQFTIAVLHNWGSAVVLGGAINGGQPVEFDRVVIESNNPVPVMLRGHFDLVAGDLFSLFLSSDFEWANFSWSDGDLAMSEVTPVLGASNGEVDWTVDTVPRPVKSAIKMLLEELYDDRNAGQENDERHALGYLTPRITAVLHRFRDPALA